MKARADPPTRGSQWQLWPLNVKVDGKTGDTSEGEAGHHRMGISTICADIVGSTSIVDDRILNRRSLSVAKAGASWRNGPEHSRKVRISKSKGNRAIGNTRRRSWIAGFASLKFMPVPSWRWTAQTDSPFPLLNQSQSTRPSTSRTCWRRFHDRRSAGYSAGREMDTQGLLRIRDQAASGRARFHASALLFICPA